MELAQLAGWTPIRIYWQQSRPMVDWCYLGERRFIEPFFDETIERCLQHPFNLLFRHQTPLDALVELQAVQPGLPPTGFIFHMSRCGSTLIAQMLAALPQNIVISEAGLMDAVLRANDRDTTITDEQRVAWLQGLVSALGQPRHAQEKYCFIKFDSWHTVYLPLIQRAFPEVPWIFVTRDPVEVMVSNLKSSGGQVMPGVLGLDGLGLDARVRVQMPPDEYCARVLARICEAALQHYRDDTGRVVHYRQLPEAVYASLLDFFGVACTTDDIGQMRHVTQFHARDAALRFQDDTQTKHQAATDRLRQLADQWVAPSYQRLEALRQAQALQP